MSYVVPAMLASLSLCLIGPNFVGHNFYRGVSFVDILIFLFCLGNQNRYSLQLCSLVPRNFLCLTNSTPNLTN